MPVRAWIAHRPRVRDGHGGSDRETSTYKLAVFEPYWRQFDDARQMTRRHLLAVKDRDEPFRGERSERLQGAQGPLHRERERPHYAERSDQKSMRAGSRAARCILETKTRVNSLE